ncbi:TMEM165/GDT1 family protein [Vibrio sp. RC27]
MAELGGITQLTVVTMSASQVPMLVWLGATLALTTTS